MAKIVKYEKRPVKLTRAYNMNTVSWKDAFGNWNESLNNGDWVKPDIGHFVSHNAERIPEVQAVLNDLNIEVAHLYIGIDVSNEGYGEHVDWSDVWFWQQKGRTRWDVDMGEVSKPDWQSYELDEGDLLFVPKGIYHKVTSLEARFGISMTSESIKRILIPGHNPYGSDEASLSTKERYKRK